MSKIIPFTPGNFLAFYLASANLVEQLFASKSPAIQAHDFWNCQWDVSTVCLRGSLIPQLGHQDLLDNVRLFLQGFDEDTGLVTLKMKGACSGCPSSSITLKSGIENMLMHYIPEVKEVREAEPDAYEEVGMAEFKNLEARLSP